MRHYTIGDLVKRSDEEKEKKEAVGERKRSRRPPKKDGDVLWRSYSQEVRKMPLIGHSDDRRGGKISRDDKKQGGWV